LKPSHEAQWRIVKMTDDTADHPDMVEPAYILFGGDEATVIARPWTNSSTAC
jgi:hypothetical protein